MPFWFPGWILVSCLGPTFCCVPKAGDVSGCLEWLVAHSGSVHQILGQDFRIKASEGNQGARRHSYFHVFPYWCFFPDILEFFGIETSMVFFPHERCQKLMRPSMTTSDYHRYHDLWMSQFCSYLRYVAPPSFVTPPWQFSFSVLVGTCGRLSSGGFFCIASCSVSADERFDCSRSQNVAPVPAHGADGFTAVQGQSLSWHQQRIYLLLLTVVDFHDSASCLVSYSWYLS